jgi:hypothetical protein
MTVDEAATLHEGSYVASPHDVPAYRIRRVSAEPWISADRTCARIRLHSYSNQWVPVEGFIKAPGSSNAYRWDADTRAFVSRSAS